MFLFIVMSYMVTPFCYPYLVKLFICHPDTKYFWLKVSMFETRNAVRCKCVRFSLCMCGVYVCANLPLERPYVCSDSVCVCVCVRATGFSRARVCVRMCVDVYNILSTRNILLHTRGHALCTPTKSYTLQFYWLKRKLLDVK